MIMSHFLINTFWRLGQKYEKKNHFFLFKWELWNLLTFLHQTLTLSEKKQVAKSFWTDFILLCDADSFARLPPARPTTPPFLSNQPWTTFRHQHCIVIHNCITTTTHYCTVIVCTSTTTGFLQFWNFMLLIWLVLYEIFCLSTSKSSF